MEERAAACWYLFDDGEAFVTEVEAFVTEPVPLVTEAESLVDVPVAVAVVAPGASVVSVPAVLEVPEALAEPALAGSRARRDRRAVGTWWLRHQSAAGR